MSKSNHYRVRLGKAFTLIELLVVVSIIALLVSILLPSLSQAREMAKRTMCQSNARQLMICCAYYADDYGGYYPLVSFSPGPGGNAWNAWGTYGTLREHYNPDTSQWETRPVGYGLIWKLGYVEDYEYFYCPGLNKTSDYPAYYIFDRDNHPWPIDYEGVPCPGRSCYSFRGWLSDPKQWKMTERRLAATSDMLNGYSTAIRPHKVGVNVGYSDCSAQFVNGSAWFKEYDNSLFGTIQEWEQIRPGEPLGAPDGQTAVNRYHEIYELFDRQ